MFEKDRLKVEEAAKHLKRLFTYFPNEPVLWKEIELIVDNLQVQSKFWQIKVPTRGSLSRRISKLCDLSQVEAPY